MALADKLFTKLAEDASNMFGVSSGAGTPGDKIRVSPPLEGDPDTGLADEVLKSEQPSQPRYIAGDIGYKPFNIKNSITRAVNIRKFPLNNFTTDNLK